MGYAAGTGPQKSRRSQGHPTYMDQKAKHYEDILADASRTIPIPESGLQKISLFRAGKERTTRKNTVIIRTMKRSERENGMD